MCRVPKDTPQQNPAMCVYCGSTEHSSVQCCNRHIPLLATSHQEFQHTNSKILGKQVSSQQTTKEEPTSHMPTGIVKFQVVQALTNQIIIILNLLGETRTIVVNTQLENNIVMITILIQVLEIMDTSQEDQHSPMPGLMRDTTNSTLHPYTLQHLQ